MSLDKVAPFTKKQLLASPVDTEHLDLQGDSKEIVLAFKNGIVELRLVGEGDNSFLVLFIKLSSFLKKGKWDEFLSYHLEGKDYSVSYKDLCFWVGTLYVYDLSHDVLWSYENKKLINFKK